MIDLCFSSLSCSSPLLDKCFLSSTHANNFPHLNSLIKHQWSLNQCLWGCQMIISQWHSLITTKWRKSSFWPEMPSCDISTFIANNRSHNCMSHLWFLLFFTHHTHFACRGAMSSPISALFSPSSWLPYLNAGSLLLKLSLLTWSSFSPASRLQSIRTTIVSTVYRPSAL